MHNGPVSSLPDSVMIQPSLMDFILSKRYGGKEDAIAVEEIIESPKSPKPYEVEVEVETADDSLENNLLDKADKSPDMEKPTTSHGVNREAALTSTIELVTWFHLLPRKLSVNCFVRIEVMDCLSAMPRRKWRSKTSCQTFSMR